LQYICNSLIFRSSVVPPGQGRRRQSTQQRMTSESMSPAQLHTYMTLMING